MTPKPDFFVVGAPKCGTTAMHEYLRRHPEIFMCPRREPHFFGSDLQSPWFLRDPNAYLALFRKGHGHKRLGEKSVWYLYSHLAPQEIKSFNPDSRIIIMVRNPVDMLYALHNENLAIGRENIDDFATAVAAEGERKSGARLPKFPFPVQALFYREVARITERIQRYLDLFGWDHLHVIVFDDLKRSPAGVYRDTCKFLEVGADFLPELKVVNASHGIRSAAVRDFVQSPPKWMQRLHRRPAGRVITRKIRKLLLILNDRPKPRPPLDPDFRRQLQTEFAGEVERLSELLRRDLTHWSRTHEEAPSTGAGDR